MTHLTRAEFVDLIESPSTLPDARLRHVEACAGCRAEADALRAALAFAEEDHAPEPSPLFWDHFAARVSAAMRREPAIVARSASSWPAKLIPWAVVACVAVLVVATGIWRTTVHAPTAPAAVVQYTNRAAVTDVGAIDDDADGDEAWALVRDAARNLEWDDARAAGISAHPGAIDDVAAQLTADERVELARLVDEDLKKKGA